MKPISRREFIQRTAAGTMAAAVAPGALGQQAPAPALSATTLRTLGKTGLQATLLGMGTGVKAGNQQSTLTRKGHDDFMRVLRHAYDRGIRYFDMAGMYGSHPYMKKALESGFDRDKLLLLSKTTSRTPDEIRADVERFRQELGTDRLDIVLLHCIEEADWPETFKPGLDALADLKAKGVIRAHGASFHNLDALARAAECDWCDVVLARLNPFGIKMDAPPEQVVPVLRKAHENGKAVLGMKIAGEGQCRDRLAESIKFALGLGCVDAMPIGFLAPAEIDGAIAHVENARKA